MPYGILKVDTITFTNDGIDQSINISGIVASISGNLTATGTISGNVIRGGTTVSGATVTGAVGQFGNLTAVSGIFTTQVSGATVTGTTANFTSGNFTSISGGTHTITSGVFAAGTAANPSISFTSDPNTGIYSPGADQVAISTNGSNRLQIDSSGNVGIGATPVVTFAGQTHLTVNHSAGGTSVAGYNLAVNGTRYASFISYPSNSEALRITAESATLPITFHTNSSERMRLDSSGRLGLGTSSPTAVFHAVASSASGTSNADGIRINSGGNVAINIGSNSAVGYGWIQSANWGSGYISTVINPNGGNVGIGTTGPSERLHVSGGNTRFDGNYVSFGNNGYIRTDATNELRLQAGTSGISFWNAGLSSEAGRFDSSGRLLVGTSSSSSEAKLLVQGGSTGSGAALHLQRNVTTASAGSTIGYLRFANSADNAGATIVAEGDGTWTAGTSHPTRLVFSTTADGASSPTERMRIVSGGNLIHGTIVASNGVGANTTNSGIEVGGGAVYHQVANNSSSGAIFTNYYRGSTVIGGISQNGTTGVTYATTSDYRLKENVEPITGAADRVLQLKPSRFNFIAAPDRIVDGFIAHEAQIVVPECATGTKDEMDDDGNPVYQGIDQSKLVPLLTAALQEALAEITSLKDRVAALEAS